jgi:hypothetical protein
MAGRPNPTSALRHRWRRGGLRPPAADSPAPRRAPRARRRRRRPLAHTCTARLAPGPTPNRPSHLPAMGHKLADKAHRAGVAARVADPAGQPRLDVDRALSPDAAAGRRAVARPRVNTAKHPDATPRERRPTVPGSGQMLRLVRRSALQARARVPRGQACGADGRLVTGAKASAGQRSGPSGTQSGQAHLQWAVSAAALVCRSDQPAAQHSRARLEKQPATGHACTRRAPPVARAVSDLRRRPVAFARATCVPRSGRGAAAPGAALDHQGLHLHPARDPAACRASGHATTPLGHQPLRPARGLAIRSRSWRTRRAPPTAGVCCASPAPGAHWTTRCVEPDRCRGRSAGTDQWLGRRALPDHALPAAPRRRWHLPTCGVPSRPVCAINWHARQHPRPSADCAGHLEADAKATKPR